MRARYYNASTGRFFQEDTYLGDITDPLTLNRYAYVKNSPLNYVDPSGHKAYWPEGGGPETFLPNADGVESMEGNDWNAYTEDYIKIRDEYNLLKDMGSSQESLNEQIRKAIDLNEAYDCGFLTAMGDVDWARLGISTLKGQWQQRFLFLQ